MSLSLLSLIIALALLTIMCMKGVNIYITGIICSIVVLVLSGMDVYEGMTVTYMTGFVGFLKSYFLVFAIGTLFGKLMSASGAARSVADLIMKVSGKKYAVVALPFAAGLLAYGGINGFVIIFTVFPIIMQVFKELNLPKRLACVITQFGTGTWVNCGIGSPSILNVICCTSMGVSLTAAPVVGIVAMVVTLVVGSIWYLKICEKAVADGEYFDAGDLVVEDAAADRPNGFLALVPLLVTVIAVNVKNADGSNIFPIEVGMLLGCAAVLVCFFKYFDWKNILNIGGEAARDALSMISFTCAISGFGAVVSATAGFTQLVDILISLPIPPIFSLILAVNILAACTGSASAAATTIVPLLGPVYTGMGMDPGLVARMAAVAATGCDSVPNNGTVCSVIQGQFHETHKTAYPTIFKLTVITPIIATIAAALVALVIY